jgi:hypothetical protein
MNKEKQIEEMAKDLCALNMPCEECHLYKNRCHAKKYATRAYNAGYRKASEVSLEAVDDFQRRIRHIFLEMCCGNDYNTLNLLEIDSAIEALYDTFVAELKKKYTEDGE